MKTSILVVIGAVIAIAAISIFIYDGIMLDKICQDDGGKRVGDTCRIPIITNATQGSVNKAPVKFMNPNSMEFFYYPNPKSDPRDTYGAFMLIRLPEWMGGSANDASAFRAYSAKSLDDSCIVKYWPQQGRQRIENPCQGGMYRVIDGALTNGQIYSSTRMTALPHLELSSDKNGILYITPPKWTKTENGVISYGKQMTYEELSTNSQFLVDSFAKSFPAFPKIPLEFAGFLLSEIIQNGQDEFMIKYFDFVSASGQVEITVRKCDCSGPMSMNLANHDLEFWQLDTTVIRIGGTAMAKSSSIPEAFQTYEIHFFKNGFEFNISGKNLELLKRHMILNYFPEYDYEQMFLIANNG